MGPPFEICVEGPHSCQRRVDDGLAEDAPDLLALALKEILRPLTTRLGLPPWFEKLVCCSLIQQEFEWFPPWEGYPAEPWEPYPI